MAGLLSASSNARKSTRNGSWMWRRREAAADDGMAGIFGWLPRLTLDICRETSGSCRVSMIVDCHRNHDIQTESWWKQDSTQTTETNFQRRENLSKGMRCYRSVSTYYLLPSYVLYTPSLLPTTYYLPYSLLPFLVASTSYCCFLLATATRAAAQFASLNPLFITVLLMGLVCLWGMLRQWQQSHLNLATNTLYYMY